MPRAALIAGVVRRSKAGLIFMVRLYDRSRLHLDFLWMSNHLWRGGCISHVPSHRLLERACRGAPFQGFGKGTATPMLRKFRVKPQAIGVTTMPYVRGHRDAGRDSRRLAGQEPLIIRISIAVLGVTVLLCAGMLLPPLWIAASDAWRANVPAQKCVVRGTVKNKFCP
jgi:hypothetical protein